MMKTSTCPDWCTRDHTLELTDPAYQWCCPGTWHAGPVDHSAGGFTLIRNRMEPADQPDPVTDFSLDDPDGNRITLPGDPEILDQLAAMLTRAAAAIRDV